VELQKIADYSAEDADITMRLYTYQSRELRELGLLPCARKWNFL